MGPFPAGGIRRRFQERAAQAWEAVVDLDTEALVNYEKNHVRLFQRPIETIEVPLLLTVSKEDEMFAKHMDVECGRLHDRNPGIRCQIYNTGAHPLILSRAEEITEAIKGFLGR